MERNELKIKIEEVELELADLYSMSEEAACFRYNVDEKSEAIIAIHEELTELYKRLDKLQEEEVDPSIWVTPGFTSEIDFANWKGVR